MTVTRGVVAVVLAAVVALCSASGAGARLVHPIAAAAAPDPLIAAAGDIACDPSSSKFRNGEGTSSACKAKATGDLILSQSVDAVLALGDNQYQCGGLSAYLQSFDPAWGRFKPMIHPVPGDNEYETSGTGCASGAAGYFSYFGAAAGDSRGDTAFTLGGWRLVGLNAECGHAGGCGSSSRQATFLRNQLSAAQCTLVYWHQPFYKGTSRTGSSYKAFWDILYAGNADVVLNGHLHNYTRFAPQDAGGHVDGARGVREFIVGTGGRSLFSLDGTRNVEKTTKAYGVLDLRLHATSYTWSFVNTAGTTLDSGTASCH
jgi:calcineurin-like phosphoesterase family protein